MSIKAIFNINKGDFTLDVNLNIPAHGITALFGTSGCGKTTLLRAIAGLDQHKNGCLKISDTTWQDENIFIAPHQRSIGYVFQEANLFAHLNVQQNIEYGLKRTPENKQKISLDQVIHLLGLNHLLKRKPIHLSGGEKQRVAIARALAISPDLLLMDEPLAALDMEHKQDILPYIESLHSSLDIPIIYVSHSADEVARLADYLVLIDEGKIKAAGKICEMLTRLDLPLAHGADAETLIEASVAEHDDEFQLTYLDFSGGRFTVAHKDLEIGSKVRLRVIARDVSITLEHQTGTSILNIFPAVVDDISPEGKSQMTVRLMVGGVPMLARVTRKSAAVLELEVGKCVFAQAKTVALLS